MSLVEFLSGIPVPDNILRQELAEVAWLNLEAVSECCKLFLVHLPPVNGPGLGRVPVLGNAGADNDILALALVQLQLHNRFRVSGCVVDQGGDIALGTIFMHSCIHIIITMHQPHSQVHG
jgi:hypothetical protein